MKSIFWVCLRNATFPNQSIGKFFGGGSGFDNRKPCDSLKSTFRLPSIAPLRFLDDQSGYKRLELGAKALPKLAGRLLMAGNDYVPARPCGVVANHSCFNVDGNHLKDSPSSLFLAQRS